MGYRVKPFTMAVRDNSTQQFIDVGLLGSDVDADVIQLQEDVSELQQYALGNKHGLFGISRVRNNSNKHFLFYSEDGNKIELIRPLDDNVNQDSSAIKKIGDYYYYTGNGVYQFSQNLIDWNNFIYFGLTKPYNESVIWASTLFVDPNTNKIWALHTVRISETAISLNGVGGNGSKYSRIDMYEMSQNSDGTLTTIDITSPITLLGGDETASYIDPFLIYNEEFGYILAVKNEIQSKIEIYNSSTLGDFTQVSFTENNLVGVEAPQLVQNEFGDVILYADAYSPRTISALEDSVGGIHSANLLPGGIYRARLTHTYNQYGENTEHVFAPSLYWDIVEAPCLLRHPGFAVCDDKAYSIISKLGSVSIPNTIIFSDRLITATLNDHKLRLTNLPPKYTMIYRLSGGSIGTITSEFKRIYNYDGEVSIQGATAQSTINNAKLKLGAGMAGFDSNVDKKVDLSSLRDGGIITGYVRGSNIYIQSVLLNNLSATTFITLASNVTILNFDVKLVESHLTGYVTFSYTADISTSTQFSLGTINSGYRPLNDINYGAFLGTSQYTTTDYGYLYIRKADGAVFVKATQAGQRVAKIHFDYYIN